MNILNENYVINSQIMNKEVDNNLLLLVQDIGELITLNETAKDIFFMIPKYKTYEEMKTCLSQIYEIDNNTLEIQLSEIIDQFIEMRILVKE